MEQSVGTKQRKAAAQCAPRIPYAEAPPSVLSTRSRACRVPRSRRPVRPGLGDQGSRRWPDAEPEVSLRCLLDRALQPRQPLGPPGSSQDRRDCRTSGWYSRLLGRLQLHEEQERAGVGCKFLSPGKSKPVPPSYVFGTDGVRRYTGLPMFCAEQKP